MRSKLSLLAAALLLASLSLAAACGDDGDEQGPLKIGLLLNFGEGAAAASTVRQQSFELAIKHINEGGGVLGQPVTFVLADPTFDPTNAVEEARRLIEVEGVHAIVGPSSSANALAVAEQVAGPAGIPLISPSATSPLLTTADDRDFFFRTALSDVAQGPVLARLTHAARLRQRRRRVPRRRVGPRPARDVRRRLGRDDRRGCDRLARRKHTSPRCARPPAGAPRHWW